MAEKKVIFVERNEPVILSWARDCLTFGALIGTALALNTMMEPSGWLNACLGIAWMLWLIGRGEVRKHTMSPAEARNWLDKNYPDTPDAP